MLLSRSFQRTGPAVGGAGVPRVEKLVSQSFRKSHDFEQQSLDLQKTERPLRHSRRFASDGYEAKEIGLDTENRHEAAGGRDERLKSAVFLGGVILVFEFGDETLDVVRETRTTKYLALRVIVCQLLFSTCFSTTHLIR